MALMKMKRKKNLSKKRKRDKKIGEDVNED